MILPSNLDRLTEEANKSRLRILIPDYLGGNRNSQAIFVA
jgi:hypothetical protein